MKFTVLLALPSDIAADQWCAADTITRAHVVAETIEGAIDVATQNAAAETRDPDDPEGEGYPASDFSVVAVYAGHIMDIFQP